MLQQGQTQQLQAAAAPHSHPPHWQQAQLWLQQQQPAAALGGGAGETPGLTHAAVRHIVLGQLQEMLDHIAQQHAELYRLWHVVHSMPERPAPPAGQWTPGVHQYLHQASQQAAQQQQAAAQQQQAAAAAPVGPSPQDGFYPALSQLLGSVLQMQARGPP